MFFEAMIHLLNSIEHDRFSLDNPQDLIEDIKKLGIQKEDETLFLTLISKVIELKTWVRCAMPKGGFPMRLYSEEEQRCLSSACRGVLLHFEQVGMLPPELREVVIQQALRMPDLELDEDRLHVLIILVLFHQSGLDAILSHYRALPLMQGEVVH